MVDLLSLTGDIYQRMKYFVFIFFLLAAISCPGQNIDSLRKIVFSNGAPLLRLNTAATLTTRLLKEKPAETFDAANAGLKIAATLKRSAMTAFFLENIARAYYLTGKPGNAAYYCDKADTVLANINPKTEVVNEYIELADLYTLLKNNQKAIDTYNTIMVYLPQSGSRQALMLALNKVGILYERLHNYRQALNYYQQAFIISDSLDFAKKTRGNTAEAFSRNFMGDVMGSIKQKAVSEQAILAIIETKKSLNDTLALSINFFNLGMLYKSKRLFHQALSALKNSMQYAAQINYTDMEGSAVNEVADLYEQTNDYQQALFYLKKRQELNTPNIKKHSKTVEELQTKYEITQREEQVLHQQIEIIKRNYWIAGAGAILLLIIIIGSVYYSKTQLKQRNIAMQAIIETEENERNRIAQDLHDSVSQTMSAAKFSLTIIGGELPFVNDKQRKQFEKAIGLVDNGFKEVRTISHNMMPWALHKTGLAKVVKQFIENISTGAIIINFFSRGFEEPFDGKTEIILYRVLQECVNNVMKHAEASLVDISLIRDTDSISLTIEDNGKGFDSSQGQVYMGMGLNNLRSRVNFLNGKFELDSQPGKGTLVSIYIPISKRVL